MLNTKCPVLRIKAFCIIYKYINNIYKILLNNIEKFKVVTEKNNSLLLVPISKLLMVFSFLLFSFANICSAAVFTKFVHCNKKCYFINKQM